MVIRIGSLVERETQIDALASAVHESTHSGRVVLISGEAGFGKTSLVAAVSEGLDHRFTVLRSACEPVGIPAPFAPLFDFLDALPDELRADIRSGERRPAVYAGMLDLIKNEHVVLVLEDMHWADEATMGLTRYLGRRIEATNSTLIVTYRSEEVGPTHPLRLVIADLGRGATRIDLIPLTLAGVEEMTRGVDMNAREVHEVTMGNPFFVEEIIRHPDHVLPPTIENAILANTAQLPDEALDILYLAAVSPDGIDVELVTKSSDRAEDLLDMAVQRMLLLVSNGRVSCRHDLIRETLLRAIPPAHLRRLHAGLLDALETRASRTVDTGRLAYHSLGAGDAEKSVRYSLQAAEEAARIGTHRQAAFHYSNALEHTSAMSVETLDTTLLEAAKEHSVINDFERASELAARRIGLTDDEVARARARAWLAFFRSRENDLLSCRQESSAAIEILEAEPASEELALALAIAGWASFSEGNREDAISYGDEAVAVARAVGALHVEVHATTTAGTAKALMNDPSGLPQVEEAARIGAENELGEFATRALNTLANLPLWQCRFREAREKLDTLIEYTRSHELDAWYIAATATRALINVALAEWDDADLDLEVVFGQPTCRQTEIEILVAAAKLRARRGDPGAVELINEALIGTERFLDYESLVIVCALAMEAAWIGLLPMDVALSRYEALLRAPALAFDSSGRGQLAYWAKRLGLDPPEGRIPGASGLEWGGSAAEATRWWDERGFVVEAAVTSAMIPHQDLTASFSTLAGLGADGVMRGLQRELQRRGVKHIPRGERPTTRENPAGLTNRQEEVLGLMAVGMSNADIARELFISEKTASHHVSAVLAKLHVTSRLQAVAVANANGWVDSSRSPN